MSLSLLTAGAAFAASAMAAPIVLPSPSSPGPRYFANPTNATSSYNDLADEHKQIDSEAHPRKMVHAPYPYPHPHEYHSPRVADITEENEKFLPKHSMHRTPRRRDSSRVSNGTHGNVTADDIELLISLSKLAGLEGSHVMGRDASRIISHISNSTDAANHTAPNADVLEYIHKHILANMKQPRDLANDTDSTSIVDHHILDKHIMDDLLSGSIIGAYPIQPRDFNEEVEAQKNKPHHNVSPEASHWDRLADPRAHQRRPNRTSARRTGRSENRIPVAISTTDGRELVMGEEAKQTSYMKPKKVLTQRDEAVAVQPKAYKEETHAVVPKVYKDEVVAVKPKLQVDGIDELKLKIQSMAAEQKGKKHNH